MATKEEFIAEVTKLPGVGRATAEKLWDAGYKSLDDLRGVDAEKLVEQGLGKRAADAVVAGLEAPAAKQEVKVVETGAAEARAPAKEEAPEIVEPAEAYRTKIKPQLTPEVEQALQIRAIRASEQPRFKRYHWWYKAALERNPAWRSPQGTLNKQRRGFGYRPPRVKVGYGKPTVARGLHPSGFEEVLVHNVQELESVKAETQAARIGGTVGGRKREAIEARAAELNIRVLNPRRT